MLSLKSGIVKCKNKKSSTDSNAAAFKYRNFKGREKSRVWVRIIRYAKKIFGRLSTPSTISHQRPAAKPDSHISSLAVTSISRCLSGISLPARSRRLQLARRARHPPLQVPLPILFSPLLSILQKPKMSLLSSPALHLQIHPNYILSPA
jgi:hypothetical protein